jgi:hypothetical protein
MSEETKVRPVSSSENGGYKFIKLDPIYNNTNYTTTETNLSEYLSVGDYKNSIIPAVKYIKNDNNDHLEPMPDVDYPYSTTENIDYSATVNDLGGYDIA